jgi:hypothetical protein
MESGMQDLQYAVKEKVVEDHNVIDDAIRDEAKVCVGSMHQSVHY